MASTISRLFQPITIGDIGHLKHRVVLAPMSRLRCNDANEPRELAAEYYAQRASIPGTLLITEGSSINLAGAGPGTGSPGMWTKGQVRAWKKVTDAVHAKGSFIVAQLYGSGTGADPNPDPDAAPKVQDEEYVKKTDWTHETDGAGAQPLTIADVKRSVEEYGTAARNAIEAGFDGVEVHLANGFLLDQFLQTNTNTRRDEYGGSLENRLRFPLEALEAVVQAVGEKRVGFRVSPWSKFQGMGMLEPDIFETFSTLFNRILKLYPNIAYAHVLQPRLAGPGDDETSTLGGPESDKFLRALWAPRPLIASGGFSGETARDRADNDSNLIAFGRHFLANPDLPTRLEKRSALNRYDRSTFFAERDGETLGYTDYPFATVSL